MSERIQATTVGFYGKLPCAGDFVRRRLPDAFVDPWDEAMQRILAHAGAHGDGNWRNLDGPVWRFVLAPGVCGETAWTGTMTASRDRVGRAFPLTLAAAFDGDVRAAAAHDAIAWLEPASTLLQDVLAARDWDVERFDRACAALPDAGTAASREAAWLAANHARGACLWWTSTGHGQPAAWLATHGLPDAHQGDALLRAPARVASRGSMPEPT